LAKERVQVVESAPIEIILKPIQRFLKVQASGGILLFVATVVALFWANSLYMESYHSLLKNIVSVGFDQYKIEKPLLIWINDGLMAIFFFVVGLEIKRELLIGELSSFKQAVLPIIAAVGGMIVPAIIYLYFNQGTVSENGWGIPMATDIAFSLGVVSLLGKRVPFALKVFLTAFAIIDDIGAVIIIAFFYTYSISMTALIVGGAFFLVLIFCNILHVRSPFVYIILGIGMWIAFLKSGVHPTIAGVLIAFTIPAKARINTTSFLNRSKEILDDIEKSPAHGEKVRTTGELNSAIFDLEDSSEKVLAPAHRIEHNLHPLVAYFIMPVFAFANAGITIESDFINSLIHPVTIGILAGLFLGKQIGIFMFSWIACKIRVASLPENISWRQMYGIGLIGGIGFTMSLFIAALAFGESDLIINAKAGIILGSLLSGIAGYLMLRMKKKSSNLGKVEQENN
jgi:NhaA family Na+:H+ antiporter